MVTLAPADSTVEALRRLVEEHFRKERLIAFYADKLAITPDRLNDHVKRATGVTAGHLIRQRVLTEAKRQLVFTTQPIHEIGYDLSFSDPSHFTRFFRKQTGMTPQAFREQPHNTEAEQALLGAILVNNEAALKVSGFLTAGHFFEGVHGRIYEHAMALIERGQHATPVTLKTYFERDEALSEVGGATYLDDYIDLPDTTLAALAVTAFTALACLRVSESVRVAALLSAVEVGGLLLVIAAGLPAAAAQ